MVRDTGSSSFFHPRSCALALFSLQHHSSCLWPGRHGYSLSTKLGRSRGLLGSIFSSPAVCNLGWLSSSRPPSFQCRNGPCFLPVLQDAVYLGGRSLGEVEYAEIAQIPCQGNLVRETTFEWSSEETYLWESLAGEQTEF